jgi:hypothetical protein
MMYLEKKRVETHMMNASWVSSLGYNIMARAIGFGEVQLGRLGRITLTVVSI